MEILHHFKDVMYFFKDDLRAAVRSFSHNPSPPPPYQPTLANQVFVLPFQLPGRSLSFIVPSGVLIPKPTAIKW